MSSLVRQIPLSIVVLSIVLPMVLARRPNSRSLRTLVVSMTILVLVWGVLCLALYPRYVIVE
ncbi:MAG TPA: hypothetical protein VF765_07390 [Polyangiaceae bacterium]